MADVDELGFDIQLDDNKKIERAAKAIAEAEVWILISNKYLNKARNGLCFGCCYLSNFLPILL